MLGKFLLGLTAAQAAAFMGGAVLSPVRTSAISMMITEQEKAEMWAAAQAIAKKVAATHPSVTNPSPTTSNGVPHYAVNMAPKSVPRAPVVVSEEEKVEMWAAAQAIAGAVSSARPTATSVPRYAANLAPKSSPRAPVVIKDEDRAQMWAEAQALVGKAATSTPSTSVSGGVPHYAVNMAPKSVPRAPVIVSEEEKAEMWAAAQGIAVAVSNARPTATSVPHYAANLAPKSAPRAPVVITDEERAQMWAEARALVGKAANVPHYAANLGQKSVPRAPVIVSEEEKAEMWAAAQAIAVAVSNARPTAGRVVPTAGVPRYAANLAPKSGPRAPVVITDEDRAQMWAEAQALVSEVGSGDVPRYATNLGQKSTPRSPVVVSEAQKAEMWAQAQALAASISSFPFPFASSSPHSVQQPH